MRGGLCCALLLAAGARGAAEEDYYQLLGVSRTASTTEIKSSFRRLSKQAHPDLNREPGAADRFARLTEAYEVLTDEAKRRRYDKYGKEGLKEDGGGARGDPFDLFGSFFGGRGFRAEEEKAPPLLLRLHVSLEDFHRGRDLSVLIFKKSSCFHCRGSGADSPDEVTVCPACNGRGALLRTVQIAPGFVQQMQAQCPKCGGSGRVIGRTCHVCRGERLLSDMETFVVTIERGARVGSRVVARNAGNEAVDRSPGDVVFELHERPHAFFARRGAHDLGAVVRLTLREALLGFEKRLRHLDGRPVALAARGVTQPGQVEVVRGRGLPREDRPLEFGDLFVEYRVQLPEAVNAAQRALLEKFFAN